MYTSRLGKYQEKKLINKLVLTIVGSIALVLFIVFFGLKILINFSLLVEKIKSGNSKDPTQNALVIIEPPILDPLPIATNSGALVVSGHATPGLTLVLSLNSKEVKKISIDKNGVFNIKNITFQDGDNTISAILVDDKGNKSDISNIISTSINKKQPKLDLDQPEDNANIFGDDNSILIKGKTDEGNTVTVNDRIAVVDTTGAFTYKQSLNEGNNTITIIASDSAGNQTKLERHVTYQK
jgi:hypothetical protein